MKIFHALLASLLFAASADLLAQDPTGQGPFPAVVYSDPSLPGHTVYRPRQMSSTFPVVLWGNGSCVDSNFSYREFLAQVASEGFVVLAIGPYRDVPPPRQPRPADPAGWPPFETRYSQLLDALDWIEQANTDSSNALAGHVDTGRVAVMGHSCGALQAVKVSADPRISTTVVLNSGLFPDGDQYMIRHELVRADLAGLHAPIAYFIGGETDVAWANAEQDWLDLQTMQIPSVNANLEVGHGATYHLPGGGPFGAAPIAWLKYQLLRDREAAAMFLGEHCGLCDDSGWQLRRHLVPTGD
jgi:dienelactone hydrolase